MRSSKCGDSFMLCAWVGNHPVIPSVSAVVPISYLRPVTPPSSHAVSLVGTAQGPLARASQNILSTLKTSPFLGAICTGTTIVSESKVEIPLK